MRKLNRKIVLLISIMVIVLTAIGVAVYALIVSSSTRGDINVSTTSITATTSYSSETNDFNLTFNKAGDNKTITVITTNSSDVVLHSIYNITATGDSNLLDAVLVYFNGDYIATLSELASVPLDIEEQYGFVALNATHSDRIKFELHQAAQNSIFTGKTVNITISTINQNADYLDYIYVSSETAFSAAINDINSGLLIDTPTIILMNTISLTNSYTIINPAKIHLNGKTLSGNLTINDDNTTSPDAVLEIIGSGTFNASVTVNNYDEEKAKEIFVNHIKEVLGNSVSAGSTTNIIGPYSFYTDLAISTPVNCTFTSPNVVVGSSSNEYYSKIASIKVDQEVIEFKVVGSMVELVDSTLAHMPSTNDTILSDLFLPTYIKDENATITWTSSDTSIISNDGKIPQARLDNESVTLYAEIKINNKVLSRIFRFKVSAHNNEINFYKLVQEISPIIIANVYSSAADADDALYHLPVVDSNSNYDYRKSYVSPTNTQLFNWSAYNEIGIENITYSMSSEQQAAYEYITQSGNTLYLNTETLNNFARINVTGDFGNNETYSTYINISISVGSNTQLLEKAFTQVSEELSEISVLGNILSTRISDGMANEKGDFSLSSVYADDEDYTIEFSGTSNIIPSIAYNSTTTKYDFAINPEYFNEYETTVSFTATVYYKKNTTSETSKSRTFYVTVPAALHVDDFGTISLYNSIKYQVFNQLPSNEKSGTSGYSISGSVLTDSNLNYVLLRDIVGDANYLTDYDQGDGAYLTVANYTETSQYASGTEALTLRTSSTNESSATDTYAYDFARLIEWAQSDTRVAASTVISSTTATGIGSKLAAIKSNAEDYLNEDELSVIKACYKYYTGATDTEWESIYAEAFNEAPGYIYTKPDLLNQIIVCLSNQLTVFYNGSEEVSFSTIFGKYMEVLQRYAVSTTTVNKDDAAPCQEIYNTRYRWVESDSALSSYTYKGTSYSINYSIKLNNEKYWNQYSFTGGSSGGDGGGSASNYSTYASDRTSYITENELTILRVFWLNAITSSKSTYGNTAFNSTQLSNITSVLNKYSETYYSGFESSDFDYMGEAILNAFDACMEIPTYFSTDGVTILMNDFYSNYNFNSTKYELNSYGSTTSTSFDSVLNSSVPYVTNVDSLKATLSYFTNLSDLEIYGNSNLAAFLSENGLATLFARVSLSNTEIAKLVMQNVAHINTNFDLTNIKNYDKLRYLDLSNNLGIHSVNELVNVNRGNYTHVNITNIGVEYEYQEFAIDNIATSTCTVWYTNENSINTYTNDSSKASDLADLSDFNKFISQYMYMTNVIYNDDGTTSTVTWRIDEGNEINSNRISNAGKYTSVTSISEMNRMVSPYYYCSSSFTYSFGSSTYNFVAGNIYKISSDNGSIAVSNLGHADTTSTTDVDPVGIDKLDISGYVPSTSVMTSYEVVEEGTTTILENQILYTEQEKNIVITFSTTSTFIFRNDSKTSYYMSYECFDGIPGVVRGKGSTTNNAKTYFFLLSSEIVDNILNHSYKQNVTVNSGRSWNTDYYLCFIYYNQLFMVGTNTDTLVNDGPVSATTDKSKALIWNLIQYNILYDSRCRLNLKSNSNFRLRMRDDFTVTYHSNIDGKAQWRITNPSSTSQLTYTFYPSFTVEYTNGQEDLYEVYKVGYEVTRLANVQLKYTDLKSIVTDTKTTAYEYYLYTGSDTTLSGVTLRTNSIIAVFSNYDYVDNEISREYYVTGATIYAINIWYYVSIDDYNESNISYIENTSSIVKLTTYTLNNTTEYSITAIRNNYPADTIGTISDYTYIYDDVSYSVGDSGYSDMAALYANLTSTWEYNNSISQVYVTYTNVISASDYEFLDTQVNFHYIISNDYDLLFRYSGTSAEENIYKWSFMPTFTSYINKYGYKMVLDNGVLNWEYYSTSLSDQTNNTMDTILATANSHFSDYHYGEYYGKYYGYNGTTSRYISSGIFVRTGYVYRIMPNRSNTAFEWVEVGPYTTTTTSDMLLQLGTGVLSEGDIVYGTGTAFASFFTQGWYKVVVDEKTNIVNLVKFNDVGFTTDGESTYTKLTNDKLVARTGDYLGYSGTFTVQISAMIRVENADGSFTDYIKTYKMKFVGSLYETTS